MGDEVRMCKVVVDGITYEMPAGANLLSELLKIGREDAPGYGLPTPEGVSPGPGYTRITYPDQRDHGDHYVPHYCWHPGLSVSGNCRMCMVNITTEMRRGDSVQKMTQTTTACTNVVRDGLEIDTRSDAVQQVRYGIQEFLLLNHPLDCPECDKSGECRLQDYAFDFGRDHSRFDETKTANHIKQLGPTIDFFGTRCIQCSRCIRFADEVSETYELCFVNRGDRTVIDTFPGEPIDNGLDINVVEVCPVGALKNHDFLYQARVWSLEENESVCNLCAKGCSVRYDSLKGVVKRVMGAENTSVNGWWACNHGRLNFEWINREDRLIGPRTREDEFGIAWTDAYVSIAERLRTHLDGDPASLAVVLNCSQTVEELFLTRQLFKDTLGCKTFGAIAAADEAWSEEFAKFPRPADRNPNRRGVELVFGISNAEASLNDVVTALNAGKIKTLVVVNNSWNGTLPADLKAAMGKAEFVIGMGLYNDEFCGLCDYTLGTQTHVEKDGCFVNADWHLQAFRRALPEVAGQNDGVILQELLERLEPASGGARRQVVTAASIFKRAADAIPQLAGYTHSQLIRDGGARLV